MADDQADIDLALKLEWIEDNIDDLVLGEALKLFHTALMQMRSRDGKLYVNLLSPDDTETLSKLCDLVAFENGYVWTDKSR
jgi:hypothetical protein